MKRNWIEIAVVAAAALVAALWTQNAAIAALPAVFYAGGGVGRWRRCLGRSDA